MICVLTNCLEMLRSAVTDGITLGHPCCGVHDCKEPLRSQRAHHCETHRDNDSKCAVIDCTNDASPKHATCENPEHRGLETSGVEAHTAMFQLRRRLERLKIYHPEDVDDTRYAEGADKTLAAGEVVELEADDHPDKPENGNRKI